MLVPLAIECDCALEKIATVRHRLVGRRDLAKIRFGYFEGYGS